MLRLSYKHKQNRKEKHTPSKRLIAAYGLHSFTFLFTSQIDRQEWSRKKKKWPNTQKKRRK